MYANHIFCLPVLDVIIAHVFVFESRQLVNPLSLSLCCFQLCVFHSLSQYKRESVQKKKNSSCCSFSLFHAFRLVFSAHTTHSVCTGALGFSLTRLYFLQLCLVFSPLSMAVPEGLGTMCICTFQHQNACVVVCVDIKYLVYLTLLFLWPSSSRGSDIEFVLGLQVWLGYECGSGGTLGLLTKTEL